MLRRTCWVGLAITTISSGCTHNYYYGTATGCPPLGQAVTTQMGQVCEVPSETIVTSSAPIVQGGTGAQLTSTPQSQSQRVVISQPAYGPSFATRNRWHRADPESVATTRSEGALGDSNYR